MNQPLKAKVNPTPMTSEILELFAVRNQEGKWFRSKGYGGYGDSWVVEVKKAKLYGKIAQARSRVTFWATMYPEYGVPEVIRFVVTRDEVVVGEAERVQKIIEKRRKKDEEHEVHRKQQQLENAEQELIRAEEKLVQVRANINNGN